MLLANLLSAMIVATTQGSVPYMDFGGMYGYGSTSNYVNPYTGGLSCPAGYTAYQVLGTANMDYPVYYCGRVTTGGTTPVADFGGVYGMFWDGTQARTFINGPTGTTSCPAGYTTTQVLGSPNLDYPLYFCHRPHVPNSSTIFRFGGMYGYFRDTATNSLARYLNPLTQTEGCAAGYHPMQVLGTQNVDFPVFMCYQTRVWTTRNYTLYWPARTPNKNCRFGDVSMEHQPPSDTFISGRLEEFQSISGLAGQRIVSVSIQSPSPATFKYDDAMLLTLNNHVVMASDNRLVRHLTGLDPGFIARPVSYVWRSLLNKDISSKTQPPWCTSAATTCTVPVTETLGSLNIQIPNFADVDAAAYPSMPDTRTFRLVTIGDNNDGTFNSGEQTRDTDCTHGDIYLTLSITTEIVL